MFSWFKRSPTKALEREVDRKYEAAVQLQRSGRLREYGVLMKEIESLEAELAELRAGD